MGNQPLTEHQRTMEGFLDGRAIWIRPCSERGLLGWEMGEEEPPMSQTHGGN